MANVTDSLQTCTRCSKTKPLTSEYFRPHNEKRKDGSIYSKLKRICRECELKAAKEYVRRPESIARNKELSKIRYSKNKTRYKERRLKYVYNLTLEEYSLLLQVQNYKCAICKSPESSKDKSGNPQSFAVDHCHTTGRVRGLLCSNCNLALGLLKDSTTSLHNAIEYLKEN